MNPTAERGHVPSEPPTQSATPDHVEQPEVPYPTLCKTVFILDPVFGALRAVLIARAVLQAKPGSISGLWAVDIVAGLSVFIFGVSASVALLYGKRWGLGLAALVVIATLPSIGIGVWVVASHVAIALDSGAASGSWTSHIVGTSSVIVCRIVLLILYGMALLRFLKWSRAAAGPGGTC